jgi:radical SAM modification target selenobiotic family peptide
MEKKDLKKVLAGLGVASLISTGGIMTTSVNGSSA